MSSRRLHLIFGANLASAIVIVHALGPIGGSLSVVPAQVAVLSPDAIQVLTETNFRIPVETELGVSQGFSSYHPGLDIRSPLGTPIHAASSGVVSEVEMGTFGYGHKVIVTHDNGLWTLYAHMGKVQVKVGDLVDKDAVLGWVGLTGWTTGPHLHFEIHSLEGVINPRQVLPEI